MRNPSAPRRRRVVRHFYAEPRDTEPPEWLGTEGLRIRLLLWELADVPLQFLTAAMVRQWSERNRRG